MRSLVVAPAQKALRKVLKHRHLLDELVERIAPRDTDEKSPVGMARGSILFGMGLFFWIFGIFGLWSALAPLNAAAIANGIVVVESSNKTVQHQEGGIIDAIYIEEGAIVKKGQPLIKLNETTAKARVDLLAGQYNVTKATEARLIAERDGVAQVTWPKDLLAMKDRPEIADILDSQERLFESRRNALQGQIGVLQQRIEQARKEIEGMASQATSAQNQVKLLNDEISVVQKLLAAGNAMKPRLLGLQREAERLQGMRGEYLASIARAKQNIAESELAMINQRNDYLNRVVDELKDVQANLSDLQEKTRASEDIMKRIIIAAPISGRVNDLKVHTVGGVISPGEKLMDIVPLDEKRIIEAKVSPQDIDVVREGLEARVRLSAYKSRNVPPVNGTVIGVSADREFNERTNESFFKARVELDKKSIDKLKDKHVEVYTGMPAEVLIITGERTLLSYLMAPIRDAFNHAFREQ